MRNNELIPCPKCQRQNWHEKTHCTWCFYPLPSRKRIRIERYMNIVIALTAIAAIALVVYGVTL